MVLSVDVANQAIQMIGDNQPSITGSGNYPNPTFDSSAGGLAAAALYVPCVNTVSREFGWDFERSTVILTGTGGVPPDFWSLEYLYPGGAGGLQIRQLYPSAALDPNNPNPLDPNNPRPVRWTVGNKLISSVQTKVLWTNLANARAVYSGQMNENLWDPGFREAVVRLLASEFAMALAGRPDTAQRGLEAFQAFEGAGEARTEN